MNELISLLTDGRSRTLEMLAEELNTSIDDIRRKIEFLEQSGIICRVITGVAACSGCSHKGACAGGSSTCAGCIPEGGFNNMGIVWELKK